MLYARFIASAVLAFGTAAFAAPPKYAITVVDMTPDQPDYCEPTGISNAGHVVGFCAKDSGVPFLWTPGVGTQIVSPPAGYTYGSVSGVNASGQVAGTAYPIAPNVARAAFVWSAAHGHQLLGTLSLAAPGSEAEAINDAGQVVGESVGGPGQDWQAYRWSPALGMVDLTGSRDIQSFAYAINALGEVAGHYYDGGLAYFVDATNAASPRRSIKSGTSSFAMGLNDLHAVAGFSTDRRGNQRATLWPPGSSRPFVIDQRPLFQVYSVAHGINNAGQVVGVWREGRENFSFYWDAAEGMHRLDSLVDPADPLRSSVRIGGSSPRINQLGQVTTTALVSGVRRAVVLTPLPAR